MASQAGKLSRQKETAIAALLTAPTIEAAADQVGVTGRTLSRWMAEDQDFIREYREARRCLVSAAIGQAQKAMREAIQALTEIMNDGTAPASARVSAAHRILEASLRGVEIEDLTARVEYLEKQMEGTNS